MGTFFIYSSAHIGLQASLIRVETDISSGLPSFRIVGLPDAAISESRDRVRAAIKNSGFSFPRTRVTVNLAPADIKKQGPAYDLPIAISILAASGTINHTNQLATSLLIGELSLNGELQPVNGSLLASILAKEKQIRCIIVPKKNAAEACLVSDVHVSTMSSLREVVHFCNEQISFPIFTSKKRTFNIPSYDLDMSDIKGQELAKRALEIAAAGSHNILMNGPPGSGKTMLARAIPTILPSLEFNEALEITKIQSVAGTRRGEEELSRVRPFRSPHHSSSSVALIGGGTWPKPGEASLAHRGVLFLDEFPEFPRAAIENLRQPLEDGIVTISRAAGTIEFPAQFMLVAAMNPCPCGFLTDPTKSCQCTPSQINRYQQKISGPLMDRIDLSVEVPHVDFKKLTSVTKGESSDSVRKRVQTARDIQRKRFKEESFISNAELSSPKLKLFCSLNKECMQLIKLAVEKLHLSARAYTRVLKVARTIADLETSNIICPKHLAEAIQYRPKARE